ncbi:MAG: hypothetical protein GEU88_00670 [Solirubrobacterales bacterium]|nr:hypothetical protein [Solirubrobacterales bacterium]
MLADAKQGDDLVVAPAGTVFDVGRNRFGFAVFTVDRQQVTDADVAIYAAHGPTGTAEGPFPARAESLETEPAFVAQTTSTDPDAAKAVYVTDLNLDRPGEWRLVALVKRGDETSAVRMPSIVVRKRDSIPAVRDAAPRINTPTADQVGNIQEIDTRVPPDSMHDVDLADVIGKKPVVLLFATPALCTSRVCGPVVDVAEQVKREVGDEVAFIHMEIWEDNDPNKGPREQVRAFNLQTEPWLFVLDRQGRVSTRIEGAFSVPELERAVDRVTE